MAGVDREIRRCRLAEVEEWDLGGGFIDDAGRRPFTGKGYRIPRFAEVLEEFPDVILNVDLKQPRPSMVVTVLELLRATNASERVVLASFNAATLLEVRLRGYPGATGLGRAEVLALLLTPGVVLSRMPLFGTAAQLPPSVGPLRLARAGLIDKCHRLGMRVDFWTINDPTEARQLLELGADGIMTDNPAVIAPVLDEYRR